jgi:type II secretory pathway, pullulanase pulA glycosidase, putative
VTAISDPVGVTRNGNGLVLAPLTATILRLRKANPAQEEKSQAPVAQEEQLSAASVANAQPQALSLDGQKIQASEVKEAANQTEKALPKTGTNTSLLALLGGFLAFLAGLLTFRKKE